MSRLSKLRQWINRDDGRFFRVGNGNLKPVEIIVLLGFVAAMVVAQVLHVV